MTTATTPSWTDSATALIAPQVLVKGSVTRATLDLTGKIGADLVCFVGRSFSTGLTGNFFIRIRRMFLNKTLSQPAGIGYTGGNTSVCTTQKVGATTVASAVTSFVVNATAFTANDLLCFNAHTYTNTTGVGTGLTQGQTLAAEFMRFATYVAASTSIYVDAPSLYVKAAGEIITNQAESIGPVWLEGGAQYEIIFDASSITAGDPLIITCYYQRYDSDSTT